MATLEQNKEFFAHLHNAQVDKHKEYAQTPLCELFAKGRAFYGTIAGITDHEQVILQFDTEHQPRLKMPKLIYLVKKSAYANPQYGPNISSWTTTCIDFINDEDVHTSGSDILPIYFLKEKTKIGCGMLTLTMTEAIRKALANRKPQSVPIRFVMLEPLPPTELLMNLHNYVAQHTNDPTLCLEPKLDYDDWHPKELQSTDNVPQHIMKCLETNNVCILQGPPGTGKSYTMGSIVSQALLRGQSVCVTTQSNASLIYLLEQETMASVTDTSLLNANSNTAIEIRKTVLSAEEHKKHPFILPATTDMLPTKGVGSLLCATYYSLSRIINKESGPIFDLVIIEEASQAFLAAIAAFMKLGRKCIIVGDPMQLAPIAENRSSLPQDAEETLTNGMRTYALGTDNPSFRITTSYRLTPASANQTKVFYGGSLSSVQDETKRLTYNVSKELTPFFPTEGSTILHSVEGGSGANLSKAALETIRRIVDVFKRYYPKRRLAILTPFVGSETALQQEFREEINSMKNLMVSTVSRIQGETVDYTIYYVPSRTPSFAFGENLFNVATSRSRSTTLLLTDMPMEVLERSISSKKVTQFLSCCKQVDLSQQQEIDREEVKSYYPGLEHIVDLLLDHNIPFGLEGDTELTDHNDEVLATAAMIIRSKRLAIDPEEGSELTFESAGYRVVDSASFSIDMVL